MAPHSSTLAWKVPWTEEPGRLRSMGSLGVGYDWVTSLSLSFTGERNGNPLQCSCLENPRKGEPGGLPSMGSQSRTRLKRFSINLFDSWCSKITANGDCNHEIKRRLLLGRKVMTNLDSMFRRRDIANKCPSSQSYGFSGSHVWMWELDHKEGWVPKTDAFKLWAGEDSWESFGKQWDETSLSWKKSTLNIHWKDQCWNWSYNTLTT